MPTRPLAVFADEAVGDGILAGDDGGGFQPAGDVGFFFLRCRRAVGAGLGDDFFCRKTAVDDFCQRQGVVRSLTGNGIFRQGRAVGVPLEDEGLGNVVQSLSGDGDILVDGVVKDFLIGSADVIRNVHVAARMGSQPARIGMVAAVAAAGSRLEFLHGAVKGRQYVLFVDFRRID